MVELPNGLTSAVAPAAGARVALDQVDVVSGGHLLWFRKFPNPGWSRVLKEEEIVLHDLFRLERLL